MDHAKFKRTIHQLYGVVRDLEEMFPGRPFTPDGHLVGSLGECIVANAYGLKLMAPSTEGYDAISPDGRRVEIKATQGKSVAFRSEPEHCIAIKIFKSGSFEEIYNGPGDLIWALVKDKPLPKNGQYQIGLSKLKGIQELVLPQNKIQPPPNV